MSSVEQRSAASVTPPPASRPPTRPSARRRRLARTLIVVVLIIGGLVAVVYSISMVRHARRAEAALQAFKVSLQSGDSSAASRHLRDADAELAVAHHSYDVLPLQVLRHVPLLGWPVSDAGKLINAATQVSSAGNDALGIYEQVRGTDSKLFHNDTVSLSEVASLTPAADGMVTKMALAARQLRSIHGAFFEPGVGSARASALRQVTSLQAVGKTARTMLQLTPGLVGAHGPRTYLIAVLNPAELQGAGGSALNLLCVQFTDGHMKILKSGSTLDLTNQNTPTRFTPVPDDPWMAGSTSEVLAAVDASPDFRTSGEELMRGYTAQFKVKLDGVIALDPIALQGLMQQIPSFTTPGYGQVTADNIVPTLLVDSYTKFPNFEQRHVYNDQLMTTLLHKILGGGQLMDKGKSLHAAATDGHLQILMTDPAVQKQANLGGLLRTLPAAGHGDVLGVYTLNANASKVDYWQKRSIEQQVSLHPDGSADIVRTVRITNGAPPYAGVGKDPRAGYTTRIAYMKLATYLPATGTVRSFTRDGAKVAPTRFAERGLTALRLNRFAVAQGATTTFVLTYTLPPNSFSNGRYVVAVGAQPLVQPAQLVATVVGPQSCAGRVETADMRSGTSVVSCR